MHSGSISHANTLVNQHIWPDNNSCVFHIVKTSHVWYLIDQLQLHAAQDKYEDLNTPSWGSYKVCGYKRYITHLWSFYHGVVRTVLRAMTGIASPYTANVGVALSISPYSMKKSHSHGRYPPHSPSHWQFSSVVTRSQIATWLQLSRIGMTAP